MAIVKDTCDLSQFPLELIDAVAANAASDADHLVVFMKALGLWSSTCGVSHLPREFLLNLGACMRLTAWEFSGVTVHRDAGLPSALEAICQVFQEFNRNAERQQDPNLQLSHDVFRLSIERFGWTGQSDLQAEIVLDFPDEDVLVDTLARVLWNTRHQPIPDGSARTP
jgi:hypothetical protein